MPSLQTDLLKGLSRGRGGPVAGARRARSPSPAGRCSSSSATTADAVYLVVRGRIALTLPMQIRGGEEDVLVEEKLRRRDPGLVRAHPSAPVHPEGDGAAIESELLALLARGAPRPLRRAPGGRPTR